MLCRCPHNSGSRRQHRGRRAEATARPGCLCKCIDAPLESWSAAADRLPVRREIERIPLRPTLGSSVRLAREDECCAGHDRRAGSDERHVDILDLTRAGATGGLEGALDDVPQAVNAARAQAATKRVKRKLATEPDPTALDEVERLTLLAEAVGTRGRRSRTQRSRRRSGQRRHPQAKNRSVPR